MIFPLYCGICRHFLENVEQKPQLIRVFRASTHVVHPRTHPQEMRRRCRGCGFVNVYHPLREAVEHHIVN